MGMQGPITKHSYSFAEGYTAVGYQEWLTIQNPTKGEETINITMINGKGQ